METVSNDNNEELRILKDMVVCQQDKFSSLKNRVDVLEKVCNSHTSTIREDNAKIDDGRAPLLNNLADTRDIDPAEVYDHMKSTEKHFTYSPTSMNSNKKKQYRWNKHRNNKTVLMIKGAARLYIVFLFIASSYWLKGELSN